MSKSRRPPAERQPGFIAYCDGRGGKHGPNDTPFAPSSRLRNEDVRCPKCSRFPAIEDCPACVDRTLSGQRMTQKRVAVIQRKVRKGCERCGGKGWVRMEKPVDTYDLRRAK